MDKDKLKTLCWRLLLLLAISAWPLTFAHAQQGVIDSRKSLGYAFVSPNTRENLTLQEAKAGLNSAEEKRLIEEVQRVACRLHQAMNVQKAIGSWTDGAEHSTIIRIRTNQSSLRYAGSWLGRFARQKAVLYFRENPNGGGRMYILFVPVKPQDIAVVSKRLETSGVVNRTLAPQRQQMLVYIVDLKNELRTKVLAAAGRLRARLASISGDGEFIGDDDRDKAQQVFDAEVAKYEKAHPRVRGACRSH